jgi:hypothetical protein
LQEELKKSPDEDRKRRHKERARELESLLAKGDIKGAFGKAQKWHPPNPTCQDEKTTRKEFEELRTAVAPAGEPIPIHITPTPRTDDRPPEEEEVKKGVQRMNSVAKQQERRQAWQSNMSKNGWLEQRRMSTQHALKNGGWS